MDNNKKFENKLHIPQFKDVEVEAIQSDFCQRTGRCIDDCESCLFYDGNQKEFVGWFNDKLNKKEA